MAVSKKIVISLYLSLVLAAPFLVAQPVPILERTVSVTARNVPLSDVMEELARQGDFTFSYNPQAIVLTKSVSLEMRNRSVREVLEYLFSPEVDWKVKGKHVILKKASLVQTSAPPSAFTISGYVTDGRNGEKISEVSIYDKRSRSSSVSNRFGYYELRVDRKTSSVELTVNKKEFRDTLIYVKQSGNAIINITIYPAKDEIQRVDSLAILDQRMKEDQMAFIQFILSEEQRANAKNVKDTLEKKFQLSILPFIGSNMRLSGNTINEYSLNVFGGYSMGSRKLEIAGLFNVDRNDVRNVQLAGLFNAVGGRVKGVQAAGLINTNLKTTSGIQLAGLINSNGDSLEGIQAAGLININLKATKGASIAGLVNSTLSGMEGIQVAGLVNFSYREAKGIQVAGLLNTCTADLKGVQVAGLANIAKTVRGSQLGFLNISDSCTGVPVGFLSFVNKGYHVVEINTDEVFPVNLSIRTGVRRFYNIFLGGIKLNKIDTPLWHFGYGLGTSVGLGKRWWLNFDLTTQQLVYGPRFEEMNLLSKFHLMVDKSLTRKVAVAFGPVFNFYTSNVTVPYYESVFNKIPPYTYTDETYSNDLNIKTWIGGSLALRFF